MVVDLWGSNTANSVYSNYNGDTLQLVYSSGKSIAAACMAMAADRGYFHYDDKVCKYWPEFAQKGKEDITIADVLRHDSGLHAFHEVITPEAVATQSDPNGEMSRIIAEQEPWVWLNGPRKGKRPRQYHGVSRGYILSQILMRVDPKKELLDNGRRKNFALHYMLIFFVVLMIHRIFNGMLLNSDVKVMHGFSHIKRYAES